MTSNNESSSFLFQPQPSSHLPLDYNDDSIVPPRYCTPRTIMAVESIGSSYHSYKKANIWSPHHSPVSRSPGQLDLISARCPDLVPFESVDGTVPDKSSLASRASPTWSSWSEQPRMNSSNFTLPAQGPNQVYHEFDNDQKQVYALTPHNRSQLQLRSPLSGHNSFVPWSPSNQNDYVSYEPSMSYNALDGRNDWNIQDFANETGTDGAEATIPMDNGALSPSFNITASQSYSSSSPMASLSPRNCYFFKSYKGTRFTVPLNSRFFIIKSYSILDVNASFLHNIWTSTELGNKRLASAHAELAPSSKIFLLFLVNSSGRFCGISEMVSPVDYNRSSDIWVEQTRWKGIFDVDWLLIKNVPNRYFQHLKVPANDNKPVTNSRDTQEIPFDVGISMMKIVTSFR